MRVLHYVDLESVNISWLIPYIEMLRPLALRELVPSGDVPAWTEAIRRVLEEFYRHILEGKA